MPYVKNDWKNTSTGGTPITAERLNKMETQYDAAMTDTQSALAGKLDVTAAATTYAEKPSFNPIRPSGKVDVVGDGEIVANLRKWAFANGTDDTNAIQDCLSAVQAAGGGRVLAPTGDYTHVSNGIPRWVILEGHGYRTRFIRKANSPAQHQFTLLNANVEFAGLRHLTVHGNKSAQTEAADCINFDNTGGSFSFYDPSLVLEHVVMYLSKGRGAYISAGGRESKFYNVRAQGSDGHGMEILATDTVMTALTAAASGGTGLVLRGTNSRFVGIKAFGGLGTGIGLFGQRNTLSASEAQDNEGSGYLVTGNDNQLLGAIADSNGFGHLSDGFAGFEFQDTQYTLLRGSAMDRKPTKSQAYGMKFVGTNTFFDGAVMAHDNATSNKTGTIGSGRLFVNGFSTPL